MTTSIDQRAGTTPSGWEAGGSADGAIPAAPGADAAVERDVSTTEGFEDVARWYAYFLPGLLLGMLALGGIWIRYFAT